MPKGRKAKKVEVRRKREFTLRGRTLPELQALPIEELAKLPPVDVLRGQVLGAIVAPLTAFLGLVNASLQDLVGLIDARIDQLGGETEAPAEAAAEPEAAPAAEAEPVEEAEAPTEADATASAADNPDESTEES